MTFVTHCSRIPHRYFSSDSRGRGVLGIKKSLGATYQAAHVIQSWIVPSVGTLPLPRSGVTRKAGKKGPDGRLKEGVKALFP